MAVHPVPPRSTLERPASSRTADNRHVRYTCLPAGRRSRERTAAQRRAAGCSIRTVHSGIVSEGRLTHVGGHAGTAPASAVRCPPPAGMWPAGYPGLATATRFGRGHGPARHFSVPLLL